jgi:hypothetical protein
MGWSWESGGLLARLSFWVGKWERTRNFVRLLGSGARREIGRVWKFVKGVDQKHVAARRSARGSVRSPAQHLH